MRRAFSKSAVFLAFILTLAPLARVARAEESEEAKLAANKVSLLKGTYAFTLAETCVNQLGINTPGFNDSLQLIDPSGAETYGGASDGLMTFNGKGTAMILNGRATNIMNAANRLLPPLITPIPLGFGLGGALPFTCTGTYTVTPKAGPGGLTAISLPLTCDAVIALPNALGTNGFESTFTFTGVVPAALDHLLLTDIGNTVQPVTIFFPGNPPSSVAQQRICTRSATLIKVNP